MKVEKIYDKDDMQIIRVQGVRGEKDIKLDTVGMELWKDGDEWLLVFDEKCITMIEQKEYTCCYHYYLSHLEEDYEYIVSVSFKDDDYIFILRKLEKEGE